MTAEVHLDVTQPSPLEATTTDHSNQGLGSPPQDSAHRHNSPHRRGPLGPDPKSSEFRALTRSHPDASHMRGGPRTEDTRWWPHPDQVLTQDRFDVRRVAPATAAE